jgi:hypothetical protein
VRSCDLPAAGRARGVVMVDGVGADVAGLVGVAGVCTEEVGLGGVVELAVVLEQAEKPKTKIKITISAEAVFIVLVPL